eukprot:scaffold14045_cov92-Skeletonema_marinoi.AAC.4
MSVAIIGNIIQQQQLRVCTASDSSSSWSPHDDLPPPPPLPPPSWLRLRCPWLVSSACWDKASATQSKASKIKVQNDAKDFLVGRSDH